MDSIARAKISVTCPCCQLVFERTKKQISAVIKRSGRWSCKSCSTRKSNAMRSKQIGATRVNKKGYVEEKTEHGWVRQHRLVVERAIGRSLSNGELVHHKDGNKSNNTISNLEIEDWSTHTLSHHSGSKRFGKSLENIRKSVCKKKTTKLSFEKAAEARNLVLMGISQAEVAREMGVSPMTISRAVRGESWKYHDLSK